jgi:enoyl-CoA hydratase/carnithine racemase
MTEAVRYESADGVGVITLDRPDNRNSMTGELLDAFARASAAARTDAAVRCVIVTGTGACFSAGADFKQMTQRDVEGAAPHERSYAMYVPFLSLLDIEVPVIAAINGHAIGGGFGLALVCDIRIGARAAKYGANFCRLGFAPGMAISYLLPRAVGASRAAELLFGARLVDGDEAARIGILSSAVDASDVMPRARELAKAIAQNAPLAVRATKRLLYRNLDWDPRRAAAAEAIEQAATLATADAAEGVAALLGRRDPVFTGA